MVINIFAFFVELTTATKEMFHSFVSLVILALHVSAWRMSGSIPTKHQRGEEYAGGEEYASSEEYAGGEEYAGRVGNKQAWHLDSVDGACLFTLKTNSLIHKII